MSRRLGSGAALMAAVVALGGARLDVGINWHKPVWTGRPRPMSRPGSGTPGPEYRRTQSEKFMRRVRRRSLSGSETLSA